LKPGDTITLQGKTLHGKNRIRRYGNPWVVIRVTSTEVLLESTDVEKFWRGHPDGRWVHRTRDKNFDVIENLKVDIVKAYHEMACPICHTAPGTPCDAALHS